MALKKTHSYIILQYTVFKINLANAKLAIQKIFRRIGNFESSLRTIYTILKSSLTIFPSKHHNANQNFEISCSTKALVLDLLLSMPASTFGRQSLTIHEWNEVIFSLHWWLYSQ